MDRTRRGPERGNYGIHFDDGKIARRGQMTIRVHAESFSIHILVDVAADGADYSGSRLEFGDKIAMGQHAAPNGIVGGPGMLSRASDDVAQFESPFREAKALENRSDLIQPVVDGGSDVGRMRRGIRKLGAGAGFAHDIADEGRAPWINILPGRAGQITIRDGAAHTDTPVCAHQHASGWHGFGQVRIMPFAILAFRDGHHLGSQGGHPFPTLANLLVPFPALPRLSEAETEPASPAWKWVYHAEYRSRNPISLRAQ
jgi:hypothetical protein